MKEYKTEYKDYSKHTAIFISYDRNIFLEGPAVRKRMIEYSKLYKEVNFIIFSTKKFPEIELTKNCKIYATNSLSRWTYIVNANKIGKKIIKKINKEDPILISCQDPFETSLVGMKLINIRKNSELLLQIHTDLFSPYFTKHSFLNKIRLFIAKISLPKADTIRVVSKRIADSLFERGIRSNEIIVKPIKVNTEHIRSTTPSFDLHQKFPQFKKIILMASRLEKEKNIEMGILALGLMKNSDYGLIIVGSGSERQKLEKLANSLNLSQKVVFEGWQTDIVPYYKGCDVFLLTSWYEGYGMTLIEAQAAGCKIVSTNVGVAREIGAEIVDWRAESVAEKIIEIFK